MKQAILPTLSLCALALPALGQAASDTKQPDTPQTWQAQCVVLVVVNPESMFFDPRALAEMIYTSQPIAAEAKSVLGVSPDDLRRVLHVEPVGPTDDWPDGQARFSLNVALETDAPGARPAAEEFLERIRPLIRKQLTNAAHKRGNNRRIMWVTDKDRATEALVDHRKQVASIRHRLAELTGRVVMSPDQFGAALGEYDRTAQHLEIELAGQTAKIKALEKQITGFDVRGEDARAADPVAAELSKIVQIKTRELSALFEQYKKGVSSEDEVGQAEAALSEARMRLAERLEQKAGPSDRERTAELKYELVKLRVERAGTEAQLALVKSKLHRVNEIVDSLAEYDDLTRHHIPAAFARIERIDRTLEADRQKALLPSSAPKVIVLKRRRHDRSALATGE